MSMHIDRSSGARRRASGGGVGERDLRPEGWKLLLARRKGEDWGGFSFEAWRSEVTSGKLLHAAQILVVYEGTPAAHLS
jgi:hypothetical protein